MTVFLDSCALIYWLEGREPWRAKVVAALRALHEQADANAELCISRLAVLECLVKPLRDGGQRAEAAYRHFFAGDDLRIVEIKCLSSSRYETARTTKGESERLSPLETPSLRSPRQAAGNG